MFKLNKQVPIENLISRQVSFWETSNKTSVAKKAGLFPNITISREPGSHGGFLAQQLAERLHWKLFGREIVDYIASNTNIRRNIVKLFDEKTRNEMESLIATLINGHAMSKEMYLKQLAKTIITIGRHSNSIILGRGGNFIIPDNMAFKVRVIEDYEGRLRNILYGQPDVKIDEKSLKKEEADQQAFVHKYFKARISDPIHYDITINLSKVDLTAAEEMVISGLCKKYNLPEEGLKAIPE